MKTPKLLFRLMLICCLTALLSGCHKKLEYKSLDLKTYNLAGNVKQVVTMKVPIESAGEGKSLTDEQIAEMAQTADTLNFTEEGGLYMPELRFEMMRDTLGRILGINHAYGFAHNDEDYCIYKYTYDEQGMVSEVSYSRWSSDMTVKCVYDKKGMLISSEAESSYESIESKIATTYDYLDRDAKGNWTKRIVKNEERINDIASEDAPIKKQTTLTLEYRTIEYYQ